MSNPLKNINFYLSGKTNTYDIKDLYAWLILNKLDEEDAKKIFPSLSPTNFYKIFKLLSNKQFELYLKHFTYYEGAIEELVNSFNNSSMDYHIDFEEKLKENVSIPKKVIEEYNQFAFSHDYMYYFSNKYTLDEISSYGYATDYLNKNQITNIMLNSNNLEFFKKMESYININLLIEIYRENTKLTIDEYNTLLNDIYPYNKNLDMRSTLIFLSLSKDTKLNDEILNKMYDDIQDDDSILDEIQSVFNLSYQLNPEFISEEVLLKYTDSCFDTDFTENIMKNAKQTSVLKSVIGNNNLYALNIIAENPYLTEEQFDMLFDKYIRLNRNVYTYERFLNNILHNHSDNEYIYNKLFDFVFENNLSDAYALLFLKSYHLDEEKINKIILNEHKKKDEKSFEKLIIEIKNNMFKIPENSITISLLQEFDQENILKLYMLNKVYIDNDYLENFIVPDEHFISDLRNINLLLKENNKKSFDQIYASIFKELYSRNKFLEYMAYINNSNVIECLNYSSNDIEERKSEFRDIRLGNFKYDKDIDLKIVNIILNSSKEDNIDLEIYYLNKSLDSNNIEDNKNLIRKNISHLLNNKFIKDIIVFALNNKEEDILSSIYLNKIEILNNKEISLIEEMNISKINEWFTLIEDTKKIEFDF